MIAGIGIDIFSFGKLSAIAETEEFFRQVLTPEELRNAPDGERRGGFCATLFASKEAILKALGCGLHHGLSWHDISLSEGFVVATALLETGPTTRGCHDE
jgi:holo-[acyl-carrier protein] synthase